MLLKYNDFKFSNITPTKCLDLGALDFAGSQRVISRSRPIQKTCFRASQRGPLDRHPPLRTYCSNLLL